MLANSSSAPESKASVRTQFPERSVLTEKWGNALDAGFQVIPNVLFQTQSIFKLDAVDVLILLNLNLHWWERNNLPYPPPALIAKRMGVSRRTVERRIHHLQEEGWLKRLPPVSTAAGPKVRRYDLSGLVERLQDAAIVRLNQRQYHSIRRTGKKRGFVAKIRTAQLLGTGSAAQR